MADGGVRAPLVESILSCSFWRWFWLNLVRSALPLPPSGNPLPAVDFSLPKVDVIGDCVIVAGNLYKAQPDHVRRLCRYAIGAMKAAEETAVLPGTPEHGSVRIRAG